MFKFVYKNPLLEGRGVYSRDFSLITVTKNI